MARNATVSVRTTKKPFGWNDPIYRVNFVVFTCAYDDMCTWLNKNATGLSLPESNIPENSATTSWFPETRVIVFWFNPKQAGSAIELQALIAHEAQHAVHDVLSHLGLAHTSESDEAYSYYLGWIVEQLASCIQLKPAKQKTGRATFVERSS